MQRFFLILALFYPIQLAAQDAGLRWGANDRLRAVLTNARAPTMAMNYPPAKLQIYRKHKDGSETLAASAEFSVFDTGNFWTTASISFEHKDELILTLSGMTPVQGKFTRSLTIEDSNQELYVTHYRYEQEVMSFQTLDRGYIPIKRGCQIRLDRGRRRIVSGEHTRVDEKPVTIISSQMDKIADSRRIKLAEWDEDAPIRLKLCPLEPEPPKPSGPKLHFGTPDTLQLPRHRE